MSEVPLKKVEEPSYFFRMSKYQERLVAHIKDNPDFIRPEVRRKHILGTWQARGRASRRGVRYQSMTLAWRRQGGEAGGAVCRGSLPR